MERIINLRKKRLESKLHRKYVLNLLNEPQHLAAIKTPKLPKIPNKGVTNLRERKRFSTETKNANVRWKRVKTSFYAV